MKYGMDPQEEILRSPNYPDGLDWGKDWGLEPEERWGTLTQVGQTPRKIETERGDYRGFYLNMRDAIEGKAPLEVPPEQFLRTQRGLLLAHKSSREGRVLNWNEAQEYPRAAASENSIPVGEDLSSLSILYALLTPFL